MDEQTSNKEELIKGIEQDAGAEARRLIEEAEKDVKDRLAAVDSQVASILREAETWARAQVGAIERMNTSSIHVETRRISLKKRGEILKEIIARVEKRLAERIGDKGYKELLVNWIVEAAIGLNADKAVINASKKERPLIDSDMLRAAEAKIREFINKKVELSVSGEEEPLAQGVILYTTDKTMAFNNQIPTRLLRYQSEIRKLIYDELFKELGEE
jgi:vacuolar-type H+-ATPase subunit E/Vma4